MSVFSAESSLRTASHSAVAFATAVKSTSFVSPDPSSISVFSRTASLSAVAFATAVKSTSFSSPDPHLCLFPLQNLL